jgi:hypothetical protein
VPWSSIRPESNKIQSRDWTHGIYIK